MDYRLLAIPLISALIGWATNALAVRMLFRPRRRMNVLGVKIQGLLPRRQPELAAHLGRTVEEHLISHDDVRAALGRPEVHEGVHAMLREKVAYFLDNRLSTLNPMIGMFLKGEIRDKLEGMLLSELEPLIPAFAERLMDKVEEHLDFREMVEEKVAQFEMEKLEKIVRDIASRELRAIEWIGGLLGLLIGFVQVGIVVWLKG